MNFDDLMEKSSKRMTELYVEYSATFHDKYHSKGGLAVKRAQLKRDACILSLVWECAVALHTAGRGASKIEATDSKVALQKLGLED